MKAHDLAKILLENENLEVTIMAHGHFYDSSTITNSVNIGKCINHYSKEDRESIIIGNFFV